MDIHIDIRQVHAVGDDLATLADNAVAHDLDSTTVAAEAHPDWLVSGVAPGCQNAWETHLGYLVGEINSTAEKLHASASSISRTDAEAARRLNQVLAELSG
jgi:hypothetical protein